MSAASVPLSARAGAVYRPVGPTRAARLRDLERRARESWLLGGPFLPYDAECWDVTDWLPAVEGPSPLRTRQRLWFSAKPGHHAAKPMQPVVADFAKAYVRLGSEGLGPSAIRSRLYAVRHVGDALAEERGKGIWDCTLSTFARAQAIAWESLGAGAALAVAVQLEILARFLGACRLTRLPVGRWQHSVTLPAMPEGTSGPEFHARAAARLPTEEFLTACAEAFQASVEARDVIVSSALALMACAGGGSRAGEVLRMREDARTATGLILPGSKGAAVHERAVIARMAEVADIAFRRLLDATAEARSIKRAYDADRTRIHLPPHLAHLRVKTLLTMREAATIIGLRPGCSFTTYARANRLVPVSSGTPGSPSRRLYLPFADIERHVLAQVDEQMSLAGGKDYHPLLVVRWGQFRRSVGSPCMFESFGYQTLHRSIKPIRGRPSMFKRQGLDPSGTVTGESKSIRHLLNTLAHMVGLSEEDVAEISGRVGTGHNRHYDHTPPEAPLDDLDGFARHRERKRGKGGDDGK